MTEPRRICIVDDDRIARETAAGLLFPEGYELLFVDHAPDLLERLPELRPDVLLLDVMMPGMDGFEICQLLKSDPSWRHIPIVLVTALDGREDLIRGLNAGADEFLAKPVNGPELRARVRSMLRIKQQYDQLQEAVKIREDLAHMIVHDIRVPLSAILLYCHLMESRESLDPKDREDLEVIARQGRRLDSFVNDLLTLAKMEEGRMVLRGGSVNLDAFFEEVAQVHRAVARSREVNLDLELAQGLPVLVLDSNLFGRVLDNLLTNALSVSKRGDTVTLKAYQASRKEESSGVGPEVVIQVLDQGPGIPEDQREVIFERFQSVERAERRGPRHGLGLTFAKQVVEAHGGSIRVESNSPRGTIFIIEI
ncbi:MAG: hybrid sensor histidine kinase/response regulator [Deltaproteobacteria bacterium]|nr:hybrid sensor histidine kinase/response regulator [Deltaproteobacteria bacterium]